MLLIFEIEDNFVKNQQVRYSRRGLYIVSLGSLGITSEAYSSREGQVQSPQSH